MIASFRGSKTLTMGLYDVSGQVERMTGAGHEKWWSHFDAINEIIQPAHAGSRLDVPSFCHHRCLKRRMMRVSGVARFGARIDPASPAYKMRAL